ncbi:MAG: hypothetical protein NC200_02195 [Candidatus Gastranaerophilales bacterium]|nr:hypothetical protein [Candidatus Gastranaerophilales bacterium]
MQKPAKNIFTGFYVYMISSVTQNQPTFGGIPIAKANIRSAGKIFNYDLYQVTPTDAEYLRSLADNMDMQKMFPNLDEQGRKVWFDMIEKGLKSNISGDKKSILLAENNVPCGIMNYTAGSRKFSVNYVAGWQKSKDEPIPAKATLMFMELFKQLNEKDAHYVELSALRYGPVEVISKYMRLGFKMCGGDNYEETMQANKNTVAKKLAELNQKIDFTSIQDGKDVPLSKVFNA